MLTADNVDVFRVAKVIDIDQLCREGRLQLQGALCNAMYTNKVKEMMKSANKPAKAAMVAAGGKHASRWLTRPLIDIDVMMNRVQFSQAVRHRLHIQPADVLPTHICKHVSGGVDITTEPHHAYICEKEKRISHTTRHELVVDVLVKCCRQVGVYCTRDVPSVKNQLADLFIDTGSHQMLVDVTVTEPSGKESVTYGSSSGVGKAVERAAQHKVSKYKQYIQYINRTYPHMNRCVFQPFALETHGVLSKSALEVVSVIANCSEYGGMVREQLLNDLSHALQVGNTRVASNFIVNLHNGMGGVSGKNKLGSADMVDNSVKDVSSSVRRNRGGGGGAERSRGARVHRP